MTKFSFRKLFMRNSQKKNSPRTYNCARVYVGGYCGGGTNEFEKWLECNYSIIDGDVTVKELKPIGVRGTNSEGTIFKLRTLVVYPRIDPTTIWVTNGRKKFLLRLVKPKLGESSKIFKLRL